MSTRLTQDFYAQGTIDVARGLLGQRLVHRLPDGTQLSGEIVETEAYLGVEDPAAHTFGGRHTERNAVMYGPAGFSYIYFIYGMHFCLNVVTAEEGTPEAVLLRALFVREDEPHLANGPGKLCRALQLTRVQNGLDLVHGQELWIEAGKNYRDEQIIDGPRVGIDYAADAIHWPLRFGVRQHPSLSPKRFPDHSE